MKVEFIWVGDLGFTGLGESRKKSEASVARDNTALAEKLLAQRSYLYDDVTSCVGSLRDKACADQADGGRHVAMSQAP